MRHRWLLIVDAEIRISNVTHIKWHKFGNKIFFRLQWALSCVSNKGFWHSERKLKNQIKYYHLMNFDEADFAAYLIDAGFVLCWSEEVARFLGMCMNVWLVMSLRCAIHKQLN